LRDARAINDKVRPLVRLGGALIAAKQGDADLDGAVADSVGWERLAASVAEAERLARPDKVDLPALAARALPVLHRLGPLFLDAFQLRAVPAAAATLRAVELLQTSYGSGGRRWPKSLPASFLRPAWRDAVLDSGGKGNTEHRRTWEAATLLALRDRLRAGDIWVEDSRQWRAVEDLLIPPALFAAMREAGPLSVAVPATAEEYLAGRRALLERRLGEVNVKAAADTLEDVRISGTGCRPQPEVKHLPMKPSVTPCRNSSQKEKAMQGNSDAAASDSPTQNPAATAEAGRARPTRRARGLRGRRGMRSLAGRTVVIVGASSGMGLASALAFARRGANLLLAARREEPLRDAARRCQDLGAPAAVAVPADITDPLHMATLARAAADRFGAIDVWVNMAGLSLWGPFQVIPIEAQIRLVQVNLIGVMNGTHAALPHMLARNHGVIINMSSIGGRLPMPFAAAYSASKYGVCGFTEAVRDELLAHSAVQVCGVYPGFVDTPTNLHSANYTGRVLRPAPPVLAPERVGEEVVRLALRPRRASNLGPHHLMRGPYAVAPGPAGRAAGLLWQHFLLRSGGPAPSTEGTLFDPVAEGTGVRGNWRPSPEGGAALAGLAMLTALPFGLAALGIAAARRLAGPRVGGQPTSRLTT
jgi:short-subunit dehydrogenase